MIEFTKAERALIDDCIAFYRAKTFPDYQLDKNDKDTILEAVRFSHDGMRGVGQIIMPTDLRAHALMRSIQRKCGMEVEEPEERQKRLAKERYEKRHNILIEAKKQEAKEAREFAEEKENEVLKVEADLERVKAEDVGIAKAVAEAQKKTFEAEQENARLKAELAKTKQAAKELANSKAAIEELAKGEAAQIIEIKPKTDEEKALEEKSIEELIEEMKLEE